MAPAALTRLPIAHPNESAKTDAGTRVADIAAPFPVDRGRGGRKRASNAGNLLFLYGAVLLGVLPAAYLVFSSFNIAPLGAPAAYGLDGWKAAFADPRIARAIAT